MPPFATFKLLFRLLAAACLGGALGGAVNGLLVSGLSGVGPAALAGMVGALAGGVVAAALTRRWRGVLIPAMIPGACSAHHGSVLFSLFMGLVGGVFAALIALAFLPPPPQDRARQTTPDA
jgi:hypothetical protein